MTDFVQAHPNGAIVAMDQMSLYFQATVTRVWSPIGQTPVIRTSPQRDHIHFYGALEIRLGRELAVTATEQTSEVTADFVRLLLLAFPTQPILLLLDRAPWHRGAAGYPRYCLRSRDSTSLLRTEPEDCRRTHHPRIPPRAFQAPCAGTYKVLLACLPWHRQSLHP